MKNVTKVSGEQVPFNEPKLRASLQVSGAENSVIEEIIDLIKTKLYEGMPTKLIYQYAFDMLQRLTQGVACRYKLKKAIMEMGPAGYPFEQFIGALLAYDGFQTQVSIMQEGLCVKHEVDVLAENAEVRYMIECKYHNQQGTKSDVKIPLYIQSRFLDVAAKWRELPELKGKKLQGWVVTNTRFTDDALQYGTCAGLKLMGWDYPAKGSLKERIERSHLFPITCLINLSTREKQVLMEKNIVLVNDLMHHKNILTKELHITNKKIGKLQQEVDAMCNR